MQLKRFAQPQKKTQWHIKRVKKLFQRFRNGDFDLFDRECPGQPEKFEDEELEQLSEENPTQTEKELAHQALNKQFPIASNLFVLYWTFQSDKKDTE